MKEARLAHDSAEGESSSQLQTLVALFARHMRARAMLRSVLKAEKEALAEIVWTLKAIPQAQRQELVSVSVEQAAAGLIGASD